MTKYSFEFKNQVVAHYQNTGDGYRVTSARFGIDQCLVSRWIKAFRFHGEAGLRKKCTQYSPDFKLKIIQLIRTGELSINDACAKFNIRSVTTIRNWNRLYNAGGIQALQPNPRPGRPKAMANPVKPYTPIEKPIDELSPEELRKELEYRRAEVAYLKKLRALVQAKRSAIKPKR